MALRSLGRLLPKNVESAWLPAQTRSIATGTLWRIDNHQAPRVPDSKTASQTRSFTATLPSFSAENAVEKAAPDFSVLNSASEAAASLIRNQVEELTASLPLTERLFAVVQIDGQQYRVSQDDVLTVEDW